jgi:hypothetical protein
MMVWGQTETCSGTLDGISHEQQDANTQIKMWEPSTGTSHRLPKTEDQGLWDGRAVSSRTMASNSALAMARRSGANLRGRQETGGPGMVCMWWTVLCRTLRWTPEGRISSGKSAKMVSAGVPVVMSLTLLVEQLVGCAGVESEVVSSSKRFLLRFTTRP